MTAHFKNPLLIEKGDMQYLYDHKGQKYLDLFARVENIADIYIVNFTNVYKILRREIIF